MNDLETIIKLHERLIYKISLKFYDTSKEDLYQAGVIGLIKAYKNFIDDGTTKFTTYAYPYIYGEMYDLVEHNRSIKLNKNILRLYKKIEQAKSALAQKLGYQPSSQELSSFLGIDELTIKEIENATSSFVSLDYENDENSLYDTLTSERDSINPNYIDLKDSINTLTPSEKDIINYRYFKDYTQSETASILGMSQVSVSRCEKKCLTKMYNYLNT